MKWSKYGKGGVPPPTRAKDRIAFPWVVLMSAMAAVGLGVAVLVWNSGGGGPATGSDSGSASRLSISDAPARAGGVEVVQPLVDAGRVPLNTSVEKKWMLRNTGSAPVTLGRPTIKVLEGC